MFATASIRKAVFIHTVLAICAAPAIGATNPQAAHDDECRLRPVGELVVAMVDNVPIVTVAANGHPVTLILDTGAERTVFTRAAAERIAARAPKIEFQRQINGIVGSLATREVELQSFSAGELPLPWRRVVVAEVTTAQVFSVPFDGVLGADVLSAFDIEIDLPHQRMLFYEKLVCVSAPPWAGPYTTIRTGKSRGDYLFFPVKVDGRDVSAIIDTGAQRSTISTSAAHVLGITKGLMELDQPITIRGIAAEQLTSYVHRFKQLEVGAEVIEHPQLVISDFRLRDADVVLGADFLRSTRLFMSYAALEIFLSRK